MSEYRPLQPFFSYFGAKWRMVKNYPAPSGTMIIEPFAGSACYACHYWWRPIVLIDKNPVIAGLWDYLIRVTPEEILRLPDLGEKTVDDFALPQEAKWLIGFWCNAACTTPRKSMSKWAKEATKEGTRSYWSAAVRQRIASQVGLIRHWRVLCDSYEHDPEHGATYFVDPPYQAAGVHYPEHAVDFAALGAWCKDASTVAEVIVCEAEGADWLPFRFLAETQAMTKGGKGRTSREVWWYGAPSV